MNPLERLKIAIVHYWYVRRRGGERVAEVIADMFPQADLFFMFMDPKALPSSLRDRKISTSFLQGWPGVTRHYRKLLPFFPLALEQFNLDDYDLVISSEAGPSKGVLTRSGTCHICYCHTPLRYVWDKYQLYRYSAPGGAVGRSLYSLTAHYIRQWDYAAAARVDHFVASSLNSSERIKKYYRRDSTVIYPPVDVESFGISQQQDNFYLVVSPLVSYKRVDLAIGACNELKRPLVVIGQGEELPALKKMAGPTISFLGFQPDDVVRKYYASCRALLFPGEEDIGLTPIEAQASGRPVIAYGRGGALETVAGFVPGEDIDPRESTGVFFMDQSIGSMTEAMLAFESVESRFSPRFIRSEMKRFDIHHFKERFGAFVATKVSESRASATRHRVTGMAPKGRHLVDTSTVT